MATATSLPSTSTGKPRLLIIVEVLSISALLIALFGWVAFDLARDWWTQPSLSYGLLIPPLALYFAWMYRRSTLSVPVAPESRGLTLVLMASLLFVVGKLGSEFFLQRMSMVVMLTGIVWTFWGRRRLQRLAFPLVLLAAMVPLPVIVYNALAAPLQLFASDIGANLARLAGITIYRDGNILQLANLSLGVEEACSGLNSLSSLMVGALLLGNLQCTRFVTRLLLFVMAIPIAIAVNVFRVSGTAVLADFNAKYAMGFYHSFSGWLVFLLGFGALFATGKVLSMLLDGRTK